MAVFQMKRLRPVSEMFFLTLKICLDYNKRGTAFELLFVILKILLTLPCQSNLPWANKRIQIGKVITFYLFKTDIESERCL